MQTPSFQYKGYAFVADKGYDVKSIYNTIHNEYSSECVIPLRKQSEKVLQNYLGQTLVCEAGPTMWKDGTYNDGVRTRSQFCCPLRRSKTKSCPINHKNWNNGKKHRGCFKYTTIPDNYKLSIDRTTFEFKSVYMLRAKCERYNSHFKSTGQEAYGFAMVTV